MPPAVADYIRPVNSPSWCAGGPQEILAYYASFMPPGMREEQTEVAFFVTLNSTPAY
jgi:hypothetical protein